MGRVDGAAACACPAALALATIAAYFVGMFRWLLLGLLLIVPTQAMAKDVTILAFGDSLTAGFGVEPGDSFPVQLEVALRAKGHAVRIVNAGVSGDTSAAGRDRLDWALTDDVDAVIVELGANDALRGISPAETRAALTDILTALQKRDLPVLLAGMLAPRNLGPDYAAAYDPIFSDLAQAYGAIYYPFFLDGVATQAQLNQADGLHPNRAGVAEIVKRILPSVEALLAKVAAK
jgi:acyl-CoA thioesterase-1